MYSRQWRELKYRSQGVKWGKRRILGPLVLSSNGTIPQKKEACFRKFIINLAICQSYFGLNYEFCYSSLSLFFSQYFSANKDRNTVVTNTLSTPIRARFVRIIPWGWRSHISMRTEFYGCYVGGIFWVFINLNNEYIKYKMDSNRSLVKTSQNACIIQPII